MCSTYACVCVCTLYSIFLLTKNLSALTKRMYQAEILVQKRETYTSAHGS